MRRRLLSYAVPPALAAGAIVLFEVLRTVLDGASALGGVSGAAAFAFAIAGLLGLPLWLLGVLASAGFDAARGGWRWGVGSTTPSRRAAWIVLGAIAAAGVLFATQFATMKFVKMFRRPVYQGLGAGLVAVSVGFAFTAVAGLIVGALDRAIEWVRGKLPAWADFTQGRGAALWVGVFALFGAYVAPVMIKALHTVDLRPARLLLAWAALLIAAHWLYRVWPRQLSLRLGGAAIVVVSVAGFIWSAAALGDNQARMVAVDRDTLLAAPAARRLAKLGDADADGVPRWFAGGDCDDNDSAVRPGVYDVPGDGVDQNCTGADLDLKTDPIQRPKRAAPGPTQPWHVLLITVDALRWDALVHMPNMQALARESLDYRNAYAHGAATYWSIPALLQSTLPSRLHMGRDQTPVQQAKLMTEVFYDAGWHTALFANVTVFFVRGLRQGSKVANYDTSNFTVHGAKPGSAHQVDSIRAHFARWREGKLPSKQNRLYVWGHFYDPHDPYFEVPGYPAASRSDRDRYDAIVRYTDAELGRLIEDLKKNGHWDQTVFILTADHGDEFGDHGHRFHGRTLYEEMVHVPLIVRIPGLAPQVIEEPIGHLEFAPTLLELMGVAIPRQFIGRSRAEEARTGQPAERQPVFFEVFPDSNYDRHQVGVRLGDHKLIYRLTENYFELYDLKTDPKERHNIYDTSPVTEEITAVLMNYLDHHLYWLGKGRTGAKLPPGSPEPRKPKPRPKKRK